jgi:hypothetical protein
MQLRLPGSPEAAVIQALNLLPPGVLTALNFKRKQLLDISNTDRNTKIGLIEAAKLDAALAATGNAPLFETIYAEYRAQTAQSLGGEQPHAPMDLRDRFAKAVAAVGDLADEITGAKCPNGPGGTTLTRIEANAVLSQVHRLEGILRALGNDVAAKCPGVLEGDR